MMVYVNITKEEKDMFCFKFYTQITNQGHYLDTKKIACRKSQPEKNCLHRQRHIKKLFVSKKIGSLPSKQIMVRPLVTPAFVIGHGF